MIRNEPMLISASYFWSDALNAFMFNHGPMTPTLMDVVMLTSLNIHAADRPFRLLEKASFKIETKSIGGWKGYIGKNMKTGSVSVREHTAFLNMWLEKFIFYSKVVGPTNNNLKMAVWQNHLNYPGSSAQAITIKATPAQTHFKRNNSWSVG